MGDWTATFPKARDTLATARAELQQAGRSRLKRQQAAEKGWLALAQATDAGWLHREKKPTERTSYTAWKTLGGLEAIEL